MTDTADWLHRYAQQLEDQHAPQNLTIGMRQAADQLDASRETTLQLLGQVGQLSEELERLKDGEARLRAALEDIARTTYGYEPWMPDEEAKNYFSSLFFGAQAKARAALKPPTPPEAHNDRQV